jgi:uncharacterized protein DUF6065
LPEPSASPGTRTAALSEQGAGLEKSELPLAGGATPGAPLISFYQMIPGVRPPQRADRAAAGTMPTRAFRFCEAMRSASAFGWYLFPPIGFSVIWDGGSDILWTYPGADAWYPLKTAQFPGFAAHFDRIAPREMRGFSPPFLAAFKEPGIIQIWTGLVARTASGWNLLVRPPANLARSQAYDFFEGIVETDRWFGPIFTNIRLTRTNAPIEFDVDFPFLQVQPVHRNLCHDALDDFETVSDLERFEPRDWEAFHKTVVRPSSDPDRPPGQYAARVRKRRKQEPAADPVEKDPAFKCGSV